MTELQGRPASDTSSTVFRWGVASGDPTATSIVLWTRVELAALRAPDSIGTPEAHAPREPLRVDWDLWEDGATPASAVSSGVVTAESDGTVFVHVTELTPGRRYAYRFGVQGAWSAHGRTATLDPDSDRVRLGIACCARLASGALVAYDGLRMADPDLVVHLGDYIYEDGGGAGDAGETPEPPWECMTFDDYSARYGQYRRDESLQRLHQSTPWVATPDDHEITDDAFPPDGKSAASPVDPPSPERKADAIAAHQRWMPQSAHGNGPTTYDRHVPLGRVGDLIMVDTRLGGRQEPAGSGPTGVGDRDDGAGQPDDQAADSDQAAGRRSLLSAAQWEWLDRLIGENGANSANDRPWLILASQVQVAPLRLGWLPRRSWPPGVRPVVNPDQWDGYPADRLRLVELLDRHGVDKVLILSGDLHSRFVTTIDRGIERGNRRRLVEVTTPSVTAPTFASLIERRLPLPSRWRVWRLIARWIRAINPHIVAMDLDQHGTTLLEIDAASITISGLSPTGQATQRWRLTADGVADVE